jgi:hypothetical protein
MPASLKNSGIQGYKSIFNIFPILEWINKNSSIHENLKMRFPASINSWYEFIPANLKKDIFQVLVKLLTTTERIGIQFEVLKALAPFIEDTGAEELDFAKAYQEILPIMMKVIGQIKNVDHIYHMITTIDKILVKLIQSQSFDPDLHVQCLNPKILLAEYNFLNCGAIFKILKHIITTFEFGTEMPQIYFKGMEVLNHVLPHIMKEEDLCIYSFWFFITKEVPKTDTNKAIIQELVNMVNNHIDFFSNNRGVLENDKILSIIDETLLINHELPFK